MEREEETHMMMDIVHQFNGLREACRLVICYSHSKMLSFLCGLPDWPYFLPKEIMGGSDICVAVSFSPAVLLPLFKKLFFGILDPFYGDKSEFIFLNTSFHLPSLPPSFPSLLACFLSFPPSKNTYSEG